MISKIMQTFKSFILLAAVFSFVACGRSLNGNMQASEEFKRSLFKEPDQTLTNTVPDKFKEFDVYDIVDVQVAADAAVTSISARVVVSSSAGRETVELVGMLSPDGSASLVDLAPLQDGKNRLVAQATCADVGVCKNIIVNVYYNVGGVTKKKQFASAALLADDSTPSASAAGSKDSDDHEDDAHDSEKDLADETDDSDTAAGEFVGTARNEGLINKLYPRSEIPELLPALPTGAADPKADAKDSKVPTSPVPPTKSNTPAKPGVKAPSKPATPTTKGGKAATPVPTAKNPTKNSQTKPAAAPKKDERGYVERARDWVVSWFTPAEEKKETPKAPTKTSVTKIIPANPTNQVPAQAGRAGSRVSTSPAKNATPKPPAQAGRAGSRYVPPTKAPTQIPAQVRTKVPGKSPVKPSAPTPAKPVTPVKPAPVKPVVQPKPTTPVKPVVTPKTEVPAKPVAASVKPVEPVKQETAPAPAPAPATAPAPAPAQPPAPAPVPASSRAPAPPTAPAPAPAPKAEAEAEPAPLKSALPFPPATPGPDDSEQDKKIVDFELRSAPLLNLRDGGISQGSYSGAGRPQAKIVNASLLPDSGRGLTAIRINAGAHYGSGMLVSFLQNAASYLSRQLGLTLFVGDMSIRTGGRFGASHKTHRNGLDADIAYLAIKNPLRDSALGSDGKVVDNFNFQATWKFLKLAFEQEFVSERKTVSSISRVFMSHRVKDGFCAWAKEKDLLDDPKNSELIRLIRREKGHHKHFHLSMKCSPYYSTCRNLAGPPPPGPGCP